MKTTITRGSICVKGPYGLVYRVCDIFYHLNDDDAFRYVFKPNYAVISLTEADFFQGIPGLNLELKKEEYVRENVVPVFISERVPGPNREDLQELLAKAGMAFMDPIEYLIRTDEQYFGDSLFVLPYRPKQTFPLIEGGSHKTNASLIKEALTHLCYGDDLSASGHLVDDASRLAFHDVFLSLYSRAYEGSRRKRNEGIEKAKQQGRYKGRKPVQVDRQLFLEVLPRVESKEISSKEGAKALGISIDKFYRLRRRFKGDLG